MPTREKIRLHSRKTLEECRERLLLATDHDEVANWAHFKGCHPILCRMKDDRFRLRCRRPGRDSFAPIFYGRLLSVMDGTVVEGQFKIHLVVRIFMMFWFGALVAALPFVVGKAITEQKSPAHIAETALGPLIMIALGYGIVRFGQWLDLDQERDMLTLLTETLEAAEWSPPPESDHGLPGGSVTG